MKIKLKHCEKDTTERTIKKKMLEYDIMGSSDLSDTIIFSAEHGKSKFSNLCGKENKNLKKVIRHGKKYVLYNSRYHYNKGWLAKYFPEYDTLLIVFFELKISWLDDEYSWEEQYRLVINREDYAIYFNKNADAVTPTIEDDYEVLENWDDAFDLCGQYIYDTDRFDGSYMPKGANLNGASGEEVCKFFKNCFWAYGDYVTHQFGCNIYLLLECWESRDETTFGVYEKDMEGINVGELKIPEHITRLIGEHAKKCLKNVLERATGDAYDEMVGFFEGLQACILENCDGEYVLRRFVAHANGNDDTNSGIMPINYIETDRVHIAASVLDDMDDTFIPLLYFDRNGIEDGVFRYCINYLEEAENETADEIKRCHNFDIYPCDAGTVNFSVAMAFCPFFEKFYNMFPKDISNNKNGNSERERNMLLDKKYDSAQELKECASTCACNFINVLEREVGGINFQEDELNKALGISKSILNLLRDGKLNLIHLRTMKTIFSEHQETLIFMDDKSLKDIIDFLDTYHYLAGPYDRYALCIGKLISMFGVQNYKNYIKLLREEYSAIEDVLPYYNYVKKLEVIMKHSPNTKLPLRWKIKKKKLDKADESIDAVYRAVNDEQKYHSASIKFKRLEKSWEKYNYHNNKFMIVYPKGPTDLVEEGLYLNHCVKGYIDIVADGGTVILFIRKINEQRKPFYTIEIRDKSIRQCHGVNNCSASSNPELMDFIQKFCENKKLRISETFDDRLGVN